MTTLQLQQKLDRALDKTLDALIENATNPNAASTLASAAFTLTSMRSNLAEQAECEPEGTVDIPEVGT